MENAIGTITNSITADALWGQVGTVMPFVVTIITFGFGFIIVKRLLNARKAMKGKM